MMRKNEYIQKNMNKKHEIPTTQRLQFKNRKKKNAKIKLNVYQGKIKVACIMH